MLTIRSSIEAKTSESDADSDGIEGENLFEHFAARKSESLNVVEVKICSVEKAGRLARSSCCEADDIE